MSGDILSFEVFKHLSEREQRERYKDLSEGDRLRARIPKPPVLGYVMCNDCIHYRKDASCDAFPYGMLREIFSKGEHATPFSGDNGICFEAGLQWEKEA